MSPASHMVGRLRKPYGILLSGMRTLNERQSGSPCGHSEPARRCFVEQLEPRLLLSSAADPQSEALATATFARVESPPSLENPEMEQAQAGAGIAPLGRFEIYTDVSLTTPGLIGSYVNQDLRSYSPQDDWRVTQVIAGTRVDPTINFTSNSWGSRAAVGLTGGSDSNWDYFSVQWDGYANILTDGIGLATCSDDGSRMWIDINGDGFFDPSGPEFVNNNWGNGQAATTGPSSVRFTPGVYKIRLQYEEGSGGNVMQLVAAAPPTVRAAYIIPSNRTAQPHAVEELQRCMYLFQNWYRDQMDRNGFGPKTFRFETESDGLTPKVYTVPVTETDDYLRGDLWGRCQTAAANAGVPLWTSGQVWLLVLETFVESADGSVAGGVALGASWGSGNDPGVAMIGADYLPFLAAGGLTNNTPYSGQVLPDLGPYPLVQDVSRAWFEGTTISSVSSSFEGAALHEMSHGLGLAHEFLNDSNFDGNLMGNGLRGFRGAVFPTKYPADDTCLAYGEALALSTSRYFNWGDLSSDATSPTLSVLTSASTVPVNGQLPVAFSATDAGGLSCALLLRNGEVIGEMSLSGTAATPTFYTPYYTAGQSATFTVAVYDLAGNKKSVDSSITPAAGYNGAPQPFVDPSVTTVLGGQSVVLDASRSSDPDHAASTLLVEWDLNGDGLFETAPTTTKTLTTSFSQPGTRLIRARLTDPLGASALSDPIPFRIVPAETPRVTAVTVDASLRGTPKTVSGIEPGDAGVKTIAITFSDAVVFGPGDVVVQTVDFAGGVESVLGTVTPTGLTGSATNTMTLTLGTAQTGIVDSWVKVTLAGSAWLRDRAGRALDGEPKPGGSGRNYVFDASRDLPSGNGVEGGDAVFYVGSLRGDFSRNGLVGAEDVDAFLAKFGAADLDADLRGQGFASSQPDGLITPQDIDAFVSTYNAAVSEGHQLDPLPDFGPQGEVAPEPVPSAFSPEVLSGSPAPVLEPTAPLAPSGSPPATLALGKCQTPLLGETGILLTAPQAASSEGSAFLPGSGTPAADDPPLVFLAAARTPLAWSTAEEVAPPPGAMLSPDVGVESLLLLPAL